MGRLIAWSDCDRRSLLKAWGYMVRLDSSESFNLSRRSRGVIMVVIKTNKKRIRNVRSRSNGGRYIRFNNARDMASSQRSIKAPTTTT